VDSKRYGPEERTWKPVENLENAKESIDAFYHHYPNCPSASDLNSLKPLRSSVHRRRDIVINESPDNSEEIIRESAETRNNSKE